MEVPRRVHSEHGLNLGNVDPIRGLILSSYYALFTRMYSVALLFSEYTMTNSSWTQAHIQSLITAGRSTILAKLLLLDDDTQRHREKRGLSTAEDRSLCEVVYPPCDTTELSKLVKLDQRFERLDGSTQGKTVHLASLAQFRYVLVVDDLQGYRLYTEGSTICATQTLQE